MEDELNVAGELNVGLIGLDREYGIDRTLEVE